MSDTRVQAAGFVVDHCHVDLFERIPDEFVTGARNLRMLFSDRSVGQNIHDALNCFNAPSWTQTSSSCRRDYCDTNWNWKTFTQADRDGTDKWSEFMAGTNPTNDVYLFEKVTACALELPWEHSFRV